MIDGRQVNPFTELCNLSSVFWVRRDTTQHEETSCDLGDICIAGHEASARPAQPRRISADGTLRFSVERAIETG